MLIDITAVSIYTLCASVIGSSVHVMTMKELNKLKKAVKNQRIELTGVEITSLVTLSMGVVEHIMFRRAYNKIEQELMQSVYNIDQRINILSDRVNKIDLSSIELKQDMAIKELKKLSKEKESGD